MFRVKICNRREIYLNRLKYTPDKREFEEKETEASLSLEKEIEILPKLTTALARYVFHLFI